MKPGYKKIGLVVRSGPFQGRAARDQLDIALSAAALGIELELYFSASGLLQLIPAEGQSSPTLPGGAKGWKSLPGLTGVRACALPEDVADIARMEKSLLLDVQAAVGGEISARLDGCDCVLVI